MTKTFKGADRVKQEMEWEAKHKDKIVVKQIEGHNGTLTVFYVKKGEDEEEEVVDDE